MTSLFCRYPRENSIFPEKAGDLGVASRLQARLRSRISVPDDAQTFEGQVRVDRLNLRHFPRDQLRVTTGRHDSRFRAAKIFRAQPLDDFTNQTAITKNRTR